MHLSQNVLIKRTDRDVRRVVDTEKNNEPCYRAKRSCPNGCDRWTYGQKCNLGTYIQKQIFSLILFTKKL